MKIGIASDHQGYERKQQILNFLREKNYEVVDYGTDSKEQLDDYNDFCEKLCEHMLNKTIDYGILICGTGIGMSICANKINGIYCGKVDTRRESILSRKHNDVNVISISAKKPFFKVKKMVLSFLHTPFLHEERYKRRKNKLIAIENKSGKITNKK